MARRGWIDIIILYLHIICKDLPLSKDKVELSLRGFTTIRQGWCTEFRGYARFPGLGRFPHVLLRLLRRLLRRFARNLLLDLIYNFRFLFLMRKIVDLIINDQGNKKKRLSFYLRTLDNVSSCFCCCCCAFGLELFLAFRFVSFETCCTLAFLLFFWACNGTNAVLFLISTFGPF